MTRSRVRVSPAKKEPRVREPTHQLADPWPFLYSITNGRMRRNLAPPTPRKRIKKEK